MRFERLIAASAMLIFGSASAADAEPAEADPPCAVADQMSATLRGEIGPGVGGVRSVMRQPYWLFEVQQNDAGAKLDILEQGADHLRDLNEGAAVPGIAPLLRQLDAAVAEARTSTEGIFYFRVLNQYTQTPVLSRRPLRPAYWATLDRVDDISDQMDDLLGAAGERCR